MKEKKIEIDFKLQMLFDQMPGCWGCKDNDSVFLYANKEYAKIIGIGGEKHFDVIGRTDFDMPCDTINCANQFRKQDQIVMLTEQKMQILDIHPFAGNEWKAYIFTKTPLYNPERNVIGTIFHGTDITKSPMLALAPYLSQITIDMPNEILTNQNSFLLTHQFHPIKLTTREAQCIFFILRGKSAKIIAQFLKISPRTVEEYIDKLKVKFDVKNKYELIDKAIQAGFLNIIPEGLLHQNQLSVVLDDK